MRQKDTQGYTAKDRVFLAFLDDHDVTIERALTKARSVDLTIKETTVSGWLSKAKRLWEAGVVRDRSSRVAENVQSAWRQSLQQKNLSSSENRPPRRESTNAKVRRQTNPLRRQEVETAAVKVTTQCLTKFGYEVKSVERDNVGWDLEAVRKNETLQIEVKGLSGSQPCIELTPNEYTQMQKYRSTYRLCIVVNALTKPMLAVFSYSSVNDMWTDQNGRRLLVEERVAARCTATHD